MINSQSFDNALYQRKRDDVVFLMLGVFWRLFSVHNNLSINSLTSSNSKILKLVKQFRMHYPTDADCFEKLCDIKGVQIKCKNCGNENIDRKKGERSFVCPECRKKNWITAGSFFEHVKKTFPWLLLIYLKENGININSNRFSKLAGVASSTAQVMYKKISLVVESKLPGDMMKVASKEMTALYGKRSLETPANKPPVSEQLELEKRIYAKSSKRESKKADKLNIEQQRILEFITDKPIHIDSLCESSKLPVEKVSAGLSILELENLVLSLPGAMYVLNVHSDDNDCIKLSSVNKRKCVKVIVDFIIYEFHRVSRKYIQIYLSAIWCQSNLALWKDGKLLVACQLFGRVSKTRLRNYVSPAVLKF